MAQDQQRLTPTERANLVAYLDGELPEGEARVISAKLTQSATARREAETLGKTWEFLDYLPRPEPSRDLSERTILRVRTLHEAGGKLERTFLQGGRKLLWFAAWTACISLAFGLGWGLTRWVVPNPTARLARDLSIAEHLNEYRAVGEYSFLKMLADSSEFGSEPEDRPNRERPR